MKKEIKQTWQFRQTAEEVWDYLTKPELMEQWLMKSDFQPVPGTQFRFIFTPKPNSPYDGTVNCEVLEIHPVTRLSYSWNGWTMDKSRNYNSTVVWTLVPNDNGTELQLHHHGFDFPEDWVNTSNGWINCVKRLEDQINTLVK